MQIGSKARIMSRFELDHDAGCEVPLGFYNSYPKRGETTAYEAKLGDIVEASESEKRSDVNGLNVDRVSVF